MASDEQLTHRSAVYSKPAVFVSLLAASLQAGLRTMCLWAATASWAASPCGMPWSKQGAWSFWAAQCCRRFPACSLQLAPGELHASVVWQAPWAELSAPACPYQSQQVGAPYWVCGCTAVVGHLDCSFPLPRDNTCNAGNILHSRFEGHHSWLWNVLNATSDQYLSRQALQGEAAQRRSPQAACHPRISLMPGVQTPINPAVVCRTWRPIVLQRAGSRTL